MCILSLIWRINKDYILVRGTILEQREVGYECQQMFRSVKRVSGRPRVHVQAGEGRKAQITSNQKEINCYELFLGVTVIFLKYLFDIFGKTLFSYVPTLFSHVPTFFSYVPTLFSHVPTLFSYGYDMLYF